MANERIAELHNARGPFSAGDSFRVNSIPIRIIELVANETKYNIQVKYVGKNYEVKINDSEWYPCSIETVADSNKNRFSLKLNVNGVRSTYSAVITPNAVDIFNEVSLFCCSIFVCIVI